MPAEARTRFEATGRGCRSQYVVGCGGPCADVCCGAKSNPRCSPRQDNRPDGGETQENASSRSAGTAGHLTQAECPSVPSHPPNRSPSAARLDATESDRRRRAGLYSGRLLAWYRRESRRRGLLHLLVVHARSYAMHRPEPRGDCPRRDRRVWRKTALSATHRRPRADEAGCPVATPGPRAIPASPSGRRHEARPRWETCRSGQELDSSGAGAF
jgi:hypothetical protein